MSDVRIDRVDALGMITLRGAVEVLAPTVESVLGLDLPDQRLMVTAGGRAVLWMSPDEFLVICDHSDAPELAARAMAALDGQFATVAVVSDARAVFDLQGGDPQAVLSKLAPVDFAALADAEVRRTRLAQVPAAFWRHADGYRLVCFRSVAVYVQELLENAAA
ncbi:sarcosine oxidase subunit gamma [Jannaschia pagri]|uniref:Sarcosine oxidase subunit gamma n=1 Tax=Jannaschia pagri TaxID=2829797 RepID=A0ABQ4NNB0_9RHOB|nr:MULTISPECIES: sarcosine oxidase subunit gamma family protein [unclassified Jannaschia]GIT92056.1 sarcosine oxidase subunit gamma [Jannaschia sp. AI_61]GIT95891.1 sarcosine oxidase subunit gamma [Jannaschia sp. AI_62]